jgi:hypothetical protein
MNASTLTYRNCNTTAFAARPKATSGRYQTRPAPYYRASQLQKTEADRAFEAGVQWFLEVSSKA